MVWKENSPVIVMITKLKEKNKVKCEPYIPESEELYGKVRVVLLRTLPRDGYTVRELSLQCGQEPPRKILHFWFPTWPDHATPASVKPLLAMAQEVESARHGSGPAVVHCSAGIGRTGCFIATIIGMQQLRAENMVDVLAIVCALRRDRGGMVQTAEQYEFVHHLLHLYESSALPE
ncbi:PTPRR [Cordylochernes scorpioides]|uniref:protein-tyrosine-phosphatase n=1 Tax=Cordylochernes scorpioides TaxID=51811 RepID=A0ABY6LGT0_9ARAC|nr:PTPRR [Cordylochernes scorpioides]